MNDRNENIFEIIDGLINQLNNTKRLFIILILTVMIIPPIVFVVSFELLNPPSLPPFNHHNFRNGHHNGIIDFIDLDILLSITRIVPTIIGIVWLAIGIRQWIVLSKWTKRYQKYKALQKKIDEKMDFDDSNDDNNAERNEYRKE